MTKCIFALSLLFMASCGSKSDQGAVTPEPVTETSPVPPKPVPAEQPGKAPAPPEPTPGLPAPAPEEQRPLPPGPIFDVVRTTYYTANNGFNCSQFNSEKSWYVAVTDTFGDPRIWSGPACPIDAEGPHCFEAQKTCGVKVKVTCTVNCKADAPPVVLMITDACPKGDPRNKVTGQCQGGPQFDLSKVAWNVMRDRSDNISVRYEVMPADTKLGPVVDQKRPEPIPGPVPTPAPAPKPKPVIGLKGLGMWGTAGREGAKVNATWYYDWNASPNMGDGGNLEYVPMIWQTQGGRGPTSQNIAAAKAAASPNVLGFNEPDNCNEGGTCGSVDSAIAGWPALMSTGKRLGSPSVAGNYGWLSEFMTKAKQKNLRVDFMAVHFYANWSKGGNGVQSLQKLLTDLHTQYQRPIWLTEFGTCDYAGGRGSDQDAANFAKASIAMLQTLPFVERYAWFSDRGYSGCNQSAIFSNGSSLSTVGQAYRDAGNQPAPLPPSAEPLPTDAVKQTMQIINQERAKRGLSQLTEVTNLTCATTKHSAEIGASQSCSHYGAAGDGPWDRAKACGLGDNYAWGEIVACGQTSPQDAVAAWIASPGHNAIMFDPKYTSFGAAMYKNYWTVLFSNP